MNDKMKRRIASLDLGLPNSTMFAGAGNLVQGNLAAESGDSLGQWLAQEFNHNFDAYDGAIDAAYNTTHIGGSHYHHIVDGQHDIIGAFRAAKNVSADDGWLTEITEAGEHLLRDSMSVAGVNPFFSLSPETFETLGNLVAAVGISKPYLADALTLNGPELLGGALALAGSILLAKKADPEKVSRLAGGCAVSALVSLNPVLLPIAAGSLAYAAYKAENKREVFASAGKGGIVSGTVILISTVIGGPAWLGCVAGLIAAVGIGYALEDPSRTFRRAQAMVEPASHVLKQVSGNMINLLPTTV